MQMFEVLLKVPGGHDAQDVDGLRRQRGQRERRARGARIHELVSAEVAESRCKLLVEVVLTIGWCTAAKTLC